MDEKIKNNSNIERMYRYIKKNLNRNLSIETVEHELLLDMFKRIEIRVFEPSNLVKEHYNIISKTFSPGKPIKLKEVLNFIFETLKRRGYYLINNEYLYIVKFGLGYHCTFVKFCKNHQDLKKLILLDLVFEGASHFETRHKKEIAEIIKCQECKIIMVHYIGDEDDDTFIINIYHKQR